MRLRAQLRASSVDSPRRQHVVHHEPRIVDLHHEARVDDALVFLPQRLRHGEHVFFVSLVVAVLHRAGTTRRRDRRQKNTCRISALERGLKVRKVLGKLPLARIADGTRAREPWKLRPGMCVIL